MTPIEGVEDISRRASQWYDPNVVDALRQLHGLKPLEVMNRPDVPRRVTTLRVLRANPGFSSLVAAMGISSLGDPLTQVATLVTIYLMTSDARFVALAFIVQALGTFVMTGALGGLTDRFSRRGLVVGLELLRAATLFATPSLIGLAWWLIVPVLFFLSCINAVVQPARQAAIPSLVPTGQVGKANAIVAATTMLAGAIGFGIAGGILGTYPKSTNMLFIADAVTFVLAAVIVLGIPTLGGGSIKTSLSGAFQRSWSMVAIRPHLALGALAAFLIPISYPALLALAYQVSSHGGQAYSIFELVSTAGIFAGTILVSRFGAIGSMRTVGAGLMLTGIFSLAIALSPTLALIGAALFVASIGNPIYAVANQTALIEAADPSNRGSIMATRFGLVQTASIIGIAVGGLITKQYGPLMAYGVLGIGLILLAMYAIAAGRPTTNPLHGAEYEEAMLGQAKT
jgi:MFS family permease